MILQSLLIDTENREVCLTLDGTELCVMLSDWDTFDLSVGDDVDAEACERLIYADEKLRCVKQAFVHLSYSSLSSKRLRDKLIRKFSAEATEETVTLLKNHRYLNDTDLCIDYARNCYEVKHHGPIRIKSDLFKLGFTSDDINYALEQIDFDDLEENLQQLLCKKYPSKDTQNIKKAFDYLYRLGYSYDDIKEAVNKYFDTEI